MVEVAATPHPEPIPAPDAQALRDWIGRLAGVDPAELSSEAMIDQLAALERVKSAAAAAQARLAAGFDQARRDAEAARGVPSERRGKGVSTQVALARRDSAHRGRQHLGLAKVLTREMPHTLAALERGDISEWRATLMARETATLSRDDRARVDAEMAGHLADLGDRRLAAEARERAYRLDPSSALRRARGARSDRRVTVRPAPDTMSNLTAFLPAEQGVAAYAALKAEADRLRATGDPRGRGQIMADELVRRLTGQVCACDVPIEVNLVMGEDSVFGESHQPAHLVDYGPVPGPVARELLRNTDARIWLRRLHADPHDGALVSMDRHRRDFSPLMRKLLVLRDQTCRTPWCDALIRHADHVVGVDEGGESTVDNGQGLCEACNYAKALPGWRSRPVTRRLGSPHVVDLVTPTGHTYSSRAPDPPGRPPPGARRSRQLRLAGGRSPSASSVYEAHLQHRLAS
jgi:hypothetical protein